MKKSRGLCTWRVRNYNKDVIIIPRMPLYITLWARQGVENSFHGIASDMIFMRFPAPFTYVFTEEEDSSSGAYNEGVAHHLVTGS